MAERIERLEKLVEKLLQAMSTVFLPREVRGALEPTAWLRTQEYFDYDEPVKLEVTTKVGFHEFKERPVKFMWLYADGANIQVSLDKSTSGESFIVPNGSLIPVRKRTKRVYAATVSGTGTLHIWGFW